MGRNIAVGLHKGYPVHKILRAKPKTNLSRRKVIVMDVAREVAGFSPYERRALDLLRRGMDKKALKYIKKQLGTHLRAKAKRTELQRVIAHSRAGHSHASHHAAHEEKN